MVHDLNSKNLHINWLFLLQNPRNHIFGVFWGIIPKWDFFPKIQFRHEKFQKNPMNRFWENVFTYWLTDILAYWQWWNHRTPFHLKVQVQQIKKKTKWNIYYNGSNGFNYNKGANLFNWLALQNDYCLFNEVYQFLPFSISLPKYTNTMVSKYSWITELVYIRSPQV